MDQISERPTGPPPVVNDPESSVLALMPSSAVLDAAIKELTDAGFDRADLSLPEVDPPPDRDTPEAGAKEADTDVDAQQARVMRAGVGGAAGAMLAATATAATGGAAAAVAGAAIGVGLLVGGAAHLLSRAFSNEEQADRDRKAAQGKLVLSVRAVDAERRRRAVDVLRAVGASQVW